MGILSKMNVFKGRTVKSKGIALTHVEQGYSANLRPVSLLMKAKSTGGAKDLTEDQLNVDVLKALRQVSVEVSMEEFLRRFFDMWSSDAELLAKLLGYETELEDEAKNNPSDEWLQDYNERVQERLAEKIEAITLLKSAKEGKELSLMEQYTVLKMQAAFEEGAEKISIDFEKSQNTPVTPVVKTDSGDNISSGESIVENTKETPVEQTTVDVTKAQEYIDLVKAMETLKAENEAAKSIIKAQQDLKKAQMVEKTAGMPFIEEAQRDEVATLVLKSENTLFLTVLEKAQEQITALTKEVADVKKAFGETEHGQDGPTIAVGDAQTILAQNIAKAVAAKNAAQTTTA